MAGSAAHILEIDGLGERIVARLRQLHDGRHNTMHDVKPLNGFIVLWLQSNKKTKTKDLKNYIVNNFVCMGTVIILDKN